MPTWRSEKNFPANHGIKEFSREEVRGNMAESFNAILERAKQGVFHFVSRQHISRYLSEIEFRHNNRFYVEKSKTDCQRS